MRAFYGYYGSPKMLEPDYCQVRLLEIRVGRRLWDSKSYGENFYVTVIKPLRRIQCRGVIQTLQETTAGDNKTPVGVEIAGKIDLTKAGNTQKRFFGYRNTRTKGENISLRSLD